MLKCMVGVNSRAFYSSCSLISKDMKLISWPLMLGFPLLFTGF